MLTEKMVLFYRCAACLWLSVLLSGCMDDALLIRDAASLGMPAVKAPGEIEAPSRFAAGDAGSGTNSPAEGQSGRYFAAIGRVVLRNHAGDDFWSAPDIYVQVQRRDPEILESIGRAEERLSMIGARRRVAEEELLPLRTKRDNSELTPGEPLSPTQIERLEELSRNPGQVCDDAPRRASCAACSRYDERPFCRECEACNELRFLREKKAASEIVPGPQLTQQELARLEELEGAVARLSGEQTETGQELMGLRESITGKTHTVTTSGYVLDFGSLAIQEVLPGDEIWIAVYDQDLDADDLYGSMALRINADLLQGGEVELAMPNVESLILRIVTP